MTSETTQLHDRAETAGIMLQAARQQRGLTVKQVADAQHLRPSIITAIEEGRYDVIGSELFLKGYIRAYASQVGLDGDAIIRSLDVELIPLRKEKEDAQKTNPLVRIERRKRKKRRIARIVIVLLLVALGVGFALQMYMSDGEGEAAVGEAQVPQALINDDAASDGDMAEAPVTEDVLPEPVIPAEGVSEPDEEIVEAESEAAAVMPEPEVVELAEVEVAPVTESINLVTPVVEADGSTGSVNLRASFSGDCWIQITDGKGDRIVAALKRSGDSIDVSGQPPLKVVVGAMSALSALSFQGEAVDLTDFRVTNNRASFSLGT